MKKSTVGLVLIVSSIATPLFASNLLHHLMIPKDRQNAITDRSKAMAANKQVPYTDFTAKWVGTCSGSEPFEMSIQNDAISLIVDGEAFNIGQMTSISKSGIVGTDIESTYTGWNTDRTMIKLNFVDLVKHASKFPYNDQTPLMTMMGEVSLSLNNGELQITGRYANFENMTQSPEVNVTCTFTKK